MSRILEKLADQHEERIINVLYKLENDIVNEVTRATKGNLVSQRIAIQLQPRLRTVIESTFLNEADLLINDDYNKVAKEVLDTFGKMPIPAKFKNLTDVDLSTINALKTQSFSGFEDIAERFLKVINDEVYQSTIAGRPFNDMVSNIKSHINGVYKSSNVTEINELVDFINENKFDTTKKAQVEDAVRKLHTQYASDRAGNNLRRYASQIAHDSVMQFHGQFTVAKAKASGLNHFTYTGTLVRDSREFCVNMLNKTLTEEQIRDMWNNRAWQGKSTGDPFIVRGGFRCRHTWIPTDPAWGEETLDEVPDEPVVEEAPTPPVVDETDIFSPVINNSLSDKNVKILPLKESTVILNNFFDEASKDQRYINKDYGIYQGSVKGNTFGKFDDKTKRINEKSASMLVALLPELETLAKKFDVSMIRGTTKVNSKKTWANMGDGVLGINPNYINSRSRNIGSQPQIITAKIKKEISELENKINVSTKSLDEVLKKNEVISFEMWRKIIVKTKNPTLKNKMAKEFNDNINILNQRVKLQEELLTIKNTYGIKTKPTSKWQRGNNLKDRPHNSEDFWVSDIDRFRSTLYHEFGHHVHQTYKYKARDAFMTKPRYDDILRPLEKRLEKSDIFNNYKDNSPTTYGAKNTKEWFVENFSLYFMEREDLVDPKFIEILKEIADDKIL